MNEVEFTRIVVSKIRPLLSDSWRIDRKIPLLYTISIHDSGNVQLNVSEYGRPIRGRGTGFEQDILLYEEVSGDTSIVPRVAMEVKFDSVTTHDALVYSEKARRVRTIYPYLRYGLLLGGMERIPPRVLRLGVEFDFIIALADQSSPDAIQDIVDLIQKEARLSRYLSKIFDGEDRIIKFHRSVATDPYLPSIAQHDNSTLTDSSLEEVVPLESTTMGSTIRSTYYVYENWTAEKKARIHFDSCSYCNYGRGIHPAAGRRNGKWHGPFETYGAAYQSAKRTGRPVSDCKICCPE